MIMRYIPPNEQTVSVVPSAIITAWTDHFAPMNIGEYFVTITLQKSTVQDAIRLEISDLYDENHLLKQPIPVELRPVDEGEFIASIEQANIAMTGPFASDALRLLREHILALYTVLKHEKLGPEPQRQLEILETYIGEKGR